MITVHKIVRIAVLAGVACLVFGVPSLAAQSSASNQSAQPAASATSTQKPKAADADTPAYHSMRPRGPLPDTLDPQQFADSETQNIYALAATEKSVLYQLPCYCRCDKEVGHKSLLDCYVDDHASHCILCKKEAVFAYTETKAGKTAAQIRKEIMDGKWKDVNLSQYDTLLPAQ